MAISIQTNVSELVITATASTHVMNGSVLNHPVLKRRFRFQFFQHVANSI